MTGIHAGRRRSHRTRTAWPRLRPQFLVALICAAAALSLLAAPARDVAAAPTQTVLVPYSSGRLRPANVATERGLRDVLFKDGGDERIVLFEEFLLRNRATFFPRVPIVHLAMSQAWLAALAPLPADMIGIAHEVDASRTIDLALRLRAAVQFLSPPPWQ